MSAIKLIIADENSSYASGLTQYLQQEYGQAFEVACFTQKALLQEHINKCEAADILLIDQKLFSRHADIKSIKSVIILAEDTTLDSYCPTICRYQRADQIAKLLLEAYDKNSDGSVNITNYNRKAKLICVYSPAGAAGKTTIAYNLSYQYVLQSRQALYISFEAYTGLPIFKQDENKRGLIYLLYLIKNGLPNLQLKLNTIKAIDENTNIHFIQRENNVLEYKDISFEDMGLLVSFFKNQSGYDAVILDLGSTINDTVLGAFKHCDYLVNVICAENYSYEKNQDFCRQITKIDNYLKSDIRSKLIWVNNKSNSEQNISCKDEHGGIGQVDIPYIDNDTAGYVNCLSEMKYYKQIYDVLENKHTGAGEFNE